MPVASNDVGTIIEDLIKPLAAGLDVSSADGAAFDQLGPVGRRDVYFASLASGNAGLALACGFLDRAYPDAGWDRIAHTYLQRALQAPSERMPGLFDGLAGLGFVADYLARGQGRYQRFLAGLEVSLEEGVDRLCAALEPTREGCHFPVFDLVSGLSGIAIFLARRRQSERAVAMREKIGAALSRVILASSDAPAWRQPARMLAEDRRPFDLNLGLAHGLPGMLVALSKFKSAGSAEPRLDDALTVGVGHLVALSSRDAFGRDWPSWQGRGAATRLGVLETRTAWCYGAPGVCSTLWLAGEAASQPAWRDLAREGMMAVQGRVLDLGWSEAPTFCHGTAGVLHVAQRFERACAGFSPLRDFLLQRLISQYDRDAPLGFQDLGVAGAKLDRLGLLQGAAGILLVLLQFHRPDLEPDWDEVFALR